MKCDKLEKLSYNNYEEFEEILNASGASFDKHLSECADCRNYLAAARKTEKFLNTMPELSPGEENLNINIEAESVKIAAKIKKIKTNGARVNKISVARPDETAGIIEKIISFFAPRMALASAVAVLILIIVLYAGLAHLNKKGAALNDIAVVNENKEPAVQDEKNNIIDKNIKTAGYIIDECAGGVAALGALNKDEFSVKAGAAFKYGDILKTAADSKCVISSELVKVKIAGSADIKLDELNIDIIKGAARMEFNKNALGARQPFKVTAGGLTAVITGTAIEARVENNTASIKLISGKIKLGAAGPHAAAVNDYSLNPGDTIKAFDNCGVVEIYDGNGAKIKTFSAPDGASKQVQPNGDTDTASVQSGDGSIDFSAPAIVEYGDQNPGAVHNINNYDGAAYKTAEIIINEQPSNTNNGVNPFSTD
jgi:hypothetical protein